MIGTTLSHYRITASLGAGGMGEVYRATDTNLDREVAIKVLPSEVGSDEERLARFRREAHLLAALNHPRVAQVYGLEHAEGQPFLVLELVEGEDLSARLAQGRLPLDEAVDVARQIAEALEEAHEKGIVHRDLKPANVKLTPDGSVKVLDFGLAKALADDDVTSAASIDLSQSPTVAQTGTRIGVILGTAGYMSPEQARGKAVDRRADIWAFGVVLYEMLTGQRLFVGETVSDTLASVLKEEPDWSALPPKLSPRLRELVQRCLNRDPKRRLQSIGEARVLLEDDAAGAGSASTLILDRGIDESSGRARPWQILSGLLALGLATSLTWILARGPGEEREVMRFPIPLAEGTSLALDQFPGVAISRDGRRQVMVVRHETGPTQLALKEIDSLDLRVLPGTEQARAPFFSPDGDWIAFFTDSGLSKVAVAGGPPIVVAAGSFGQTRGGTWSEDGTIVFTPQTAGGLKRVQENGGVVTDLTTPDQARQERTHRWPAVLPGGRAVLFTSDTVESTEFYDDARIEAVSLATGERRVVIEQSSRAEYLKPGHLLFARGGSLFAVPFDAEQLEVRGAAGLVLQQVATEVASGAAQFSASDAGSLLYVHGIAAASINQPVRFDREGEEEELGLPPNFYFAVSLSPDDRRLAVVMTTGVGTDIWVADLERDGLNRLTFDASADYPVWSPDGKSIVYAALLPGASGTDIFRRSADGSGNVDSVWSATFPVTPLSYSRDGKFLLAAQQMMPSGWSDIWVVPMTGDGEPFPFTETPYNESQASFSPDGRYVAYGSNESGQTEVYVRPFPGPGGRWQVSAGGGREPRWSRDGGELYFRVRSSLYVAAVDTTGGFKAGRAAPIVDGFPSVADNYAFTYTVSHDGRYVYLVKDLDSRGRVVEAALLLNWAQEVERLTTK